MSEPEKAKLDVLLVKMDEMMIELDTIKRGLYGDQKNKVPGLLERQDRDEQRISSIENKQFKFYAVLTGVFVAVQIIYNFIKDKVL